MANAISPASSEVSATPASVAVLSAPTGVAAVAGTGLVTLTWNTVSNSTGYNVWRGTSTGNEILLAVAGGTTYTDYAVANGTTYYYKIATVNNGGAGTLSSEVSATPTAASVTAPPALTAPATPTGVLASPGLGQIVVTWNVVPGATGYAVYRSTTSGAEVFLKSLGNLKHTDEVNPDSSWPGIVNGTTYYYKVVAANSVGTSAMSAEVSAASVSALTALPTPTSVTATAGIASVTLSWGPVAGATGYNIYRSTTSGGESVIVATTTSTTYVDSGLQNGITYFYEIVATG